MKLTAYLQTQSTQYETLYHGTHLRRSAAPHRSGRARLWFGFLARRVWLCFSVSATSRPSVRLLPLTGNSIQTLPPPSRALCCSSARYCCVSSHSRLSEITARCNVARMKPGKRIPMGLVFHAAVRDAAPNTKRHEPELYLISFITEYCYASLLDSCSLFIYLVFALILYIH